MKRLALITGAAAGLGRAIAERLAADGIDVLLADVQEEAVRRTTQELSTAGLPAHALNFDVTDEAAVAAAYADIDQRFGRLDILVNNAGIMGLRTPVAEMPLATWEQVLNVNLTGTFLMCRGAVPLMRRGGFGRIVNISSRAARGRSAVGSPGYAASKTALLGFSRVLAGEVGRDGITVNCVAPSTVVTPMTVEIAQEGKRCGINLVGLS